MYFCALFSYKARNQWGNVTLVHVGPVLLLYYLYLKLNISFFNEITFVQEIDTVCEVNKHVQTHRDRPVSI